MSINCAHVLLDLLYKYITNVSALLLGEIRCVKNVSISQFKTPSCEKKCNFIWFYLLYLQYLKRISGTYTKAESVEVILSKYMTIWPRVVDERSA